MSGYRLAVDYGTSFTAAATAEGSQPEVLEFSSARHSRYLPSLVLVDQRGDLHVGTRAVAKRGAVPADHVCAAPKRQLGPDPLTLGPLLLSASDIVAATLAKVAEEALHQHNGDPPDELVMTHPALWPPPRCEVLRDAAVKAGLATDASSVRLLAEPVAAVSFYVSAGAGPDVGVGESVAVYDLGGGTFDCAVLTRTPTGWDLAGQPGGDERLGGEDFDEALLEWVADRLLAEDPDAWDAFERDDSPRGRSDWVSLLELIRSAKEELSSDEATEIGLPPGPLPLDSLLINRAEFTVLIGQALERSMQAFRHCLDQAGVAPGDLSAVYLTGGSSRIPAVKGELHRQFGIEPTTYKDPKAITALGALVYEDGGSRDTSGTTTTARSPGPDGDVRHVEIASASEFKAALELAAAMAGGSADPTFDHAVLTVGDEVTVIGGNEGRMTATDLKGHGDAGDVLFAPRGVIAWLEEHADSRPLHIDIGADAVDFHQEAQHLSVAAVAASETAEWGVIRELPDIIAGAEFSDGAARTAVTRLRWRDDATAVISFTEKSVTIGGFAFVLRPTLDEPVTVSVPRGPLIAVLSYIGRWPDIVDAPSIAVTATDCFFLVERPGHAMVANFRRDGGTGAAPASAPASAAAAGAATAPATGPTPGPATGPVTGAATICVIPKAILGGVGAFGVGFHLAVDGREYETNKWQPVVVEVSPGMHTVDCYCTDIYRKISKAQLVVNAVAGQRLTLQFKQAPTTFQRGKLTIL